MTLTGGTHRSVRGKARDTSMTSGVSLSVIERCKEQRRHFKWVADLDSWGSEVLACHVCESGKFVSFFSCDARNVGSKIKMLSQEVSVTLL
jgi:hypothetical protein